MPLTLRQRAVTFTDHLAIFADSAEAFGVSLGPAIVRSNLVVVAPPRRESMSRRSNVATDDSFSWRKQEGGCTNRRRGAVDFLE